jgi:hypothetical protein
MRQCVEVGPTLILISAPNPKGTVTRNAPPYTYGQLFGQRRSGNTAVVAVTAKG